MILRAPPCRSSCTAPFTLSDFNETRQILEQSSNINFRESPSSGSPVVPCGPADMTKLVVAFHNVGNATTNGSVPGDGNTRSNGARSANLLKAKLYAPHVYRDGIWKLADHWKTCTLF